MIQYENSPKLNLLIDELRQVLSIDVEEFRKNFFDIRTCKRDGLNNWGRILNVSRYVKSFLFGPTLWLDQLTNETMVDGVDYENFDNGSFCPEEPEVDLVELDDESYRLLLIFTYQRMITDSSLKSINKMLKLYFAGRGICYAIPTDKMELTYVFEFTLQPWEYSLLRYHDVLPTPAGVSEFILLK